MSELIKIASRHRIERLCVFMGMSWEKNPTPERLRKENDEALQAISHWHDRAFGFCYVSGEHPDASRREMDRCIAKGPMTGVKLWVARRCREPDLDRIIEHAVSLKAVIYQHTWFKTDGTQFPGESTPLDLVELASRHPKATIICGHAGGTWELGIRAIRASPNLVLETAGFDPTNGFLDMAVRELGAERIIYGSDSGGRSFASQLSKVLGAAIPDEAKNLILGENLRRRMRPILKDKGTSE
jgi:predicted TIM-barrel fold metal-dependent hydrolase